MHKASGWMLRETGKRYKPALLAFLDNFAHIMPRTMLRYAIEKLSPAERKYYMQMKTAQ
jgi:3-methyladenine DNA glycosylase AlkD